MWRDDFPILEQQIHGKPLVYLDSGATSQKPQAVIDCINHYYQHDNANVHRGVYELSVRSTEAYEGVRNKVCRFIGASDHKNIIFTKGTTDSINLVAYGFSDFVNAGDDVLISEMEHHSNIVPWQVLCQRTGANLKIIPVEDDGSIDLQKFQQCLTDKTKLLAITHVSNLLGTVNPVKDMVAMAHAKHIPVLLDGAQAVPHVAVNVSDIDCDFYVFSAHKMYGPTGVGVLYGKTEWLEKLPPYQTGGDMISSVTFAKTQYNVLPYKFEAGTPNIAGVIAMGVAIDYLLSIGFADISEHEHGLTAYLTEQLQTVPGLTIIGTAANKIGVASFVMDCAHPHDIGTILDSEGVAIRAGHHCAMPLIERFSVPATARASLGIYNNTDDIDHLIQALYKVKELFA